MIQQMHHLTRKPSAVKRKLIWKVILLLPLFALLLSTTGQAQGRKLEAGQFGLGMRNAMNFWGENDMLGFGAGGQFKLAFSPRVNTDWFADVISSSGEFDSYRKDYHIGWGVQFALAKEGFGSHMFVPYIMAGQCFDLTRVGVRGGEETPLIFSAAVQGGAGVSSFVHKAVELNLQLQYMMHLTQHVHLEMDDHGHTHTEVEKGASASGHLLGTFSFTVYFLRLWNR